MSKIEYYDNLTKHLFSPWWMYLLMGLNFIILSVLIILFPQFLAYLVAIFLLINGFTFLGISWFTWRIKHQHKKWKEKHTIPVQ